MPLSMIGPGSVRKVAAIKGNDSVRQHLCDLGFVEGAEVEVISDVAGSLIVGIQGSRLALNADLARRIIV